MMSEKQGAFSDYIVSYDYDGDQYTVVIAAQSFKDADRRVAALRYSAEVSGRSVISIPILPKWLAWVWS